MRNTDRSSIANVELTGPDGLAVLGRQGRFAASDPLSFQWTWREVNVDGIEIVEWTTTPVSGACAAGDPSHAVVLVAVIDGDFRYRVRATERRATAGDMVVLAATDQIRFAVPRLTRCVRIAAPAEVLPRPVRLATAVDAGAVERTRLSETLTSLAEVVLDPTVGGSGCPAARAIRAVTVAALEDLLPTPADADPRARFVTYIESHLTDPDLSPQSIADAFGVSLRWAHRVFSREGQTIARYIRDRRIELVAATLRADRRFPRISALATKTGFPNRDQMTRAFKVRYGLTIAEYATQAARHNLPATDQVPTQADKRTT